MDKLELQYRQRFPENSKMIDQMCLISKKTFLDEIAEAVYWRHNSRMASKHYVHKTEYKGPERREQA